jgi:hypothetical protein
MYTRSAVETAVAPEAGVTAPKCVVMPGVMCHGRGLRAGSRRSSSYKEMMTTRRAARIQL